MVPPQMSQVLKKAGPAEDPVNHGKTGFILQKSKSEIHSRAVTLLSMPFDAGSALRNIFGAQL